MRVLFERTTCPFAFTALKLALVLSGNQVIDPVSIQRTLIRYAQPAASTGFHDELNDASTLPPGPAS
ncbi:hypothetical protein D9M68_103730 [compost metagenome]